MKHTLHKLLTLTLAGLALPTVALAHPGHFVMDPTVAPHSGHEGALALMLFGAFALVGLGVHRWIESRR